MKEKSRHMAALRPAFEELVRNKQGTDALARDAESGKYLDEKVEFMWKGFCLYRHMQVNGVEVARATHFFVAKHSHTWSPRLSQCWKPYLHKTFELAEAAVVRLAEEQPDVNLGIYQLVGRRKAFIHRPPAYWAQALAACAETNS